MAGKEDCSVLALSSESDRHEERTAPEASSVSIGPNDHSKPVQHNPDGEGDKSISSSSFMSINSAINTNGTISNHPESTSDSIAGSARRFSIPHNTPGNPLSPQLGIGIMSPPTTATDLTSITSQSHTAQTGLIASLPANESH